MKLGHLASQAAEMMRFRTRKCDRFDYGAHAMGSCRWPQHSHIMVNEFGLRRCEDLSSVHDVSYGFRGDPTLTAMAIASRSADYIADEAEKEFIPNTFTS